MSYKGLNVLDSEELRNGIKSYSNWPTIPQLYVKGEFVGGCDIVREMFQDGELQDPVQGQGPGEGRRVDLSAPPFNSRKFGLVTKNAPVNTGA